MIGFPIALQQRFDGLVLDADLSFEKFVLAFDALDIGCRDRSRLVGACRCFLSRLVLAFFRGDTCRSSSIYAMCLSTDAGEIRYFSPNAVSMRRQSKWPLAQ